MAAARRSRRWRGRRSAALGAVAVAEQQGSAGVAARGDGDYDREAWLAAFQNVEEEVCYTVACEDLPKDLKGTYFRNSPAKFKVGEDQIMHPFDADGMVFAMTFDGSGQVHYRNRFVRTKGYCEELEAGRMIYRNQFSSKPGGWSANILDFRIKNLANTSVMSWGGRLLALWEGGKPYELDGKSLATFGESNLAGALKDGDNFTAHPRYDAANDRLVGFQYQPDPAADQTELTFWEFGRGGFEVLNCVKQTVPGFGFFHDFVVTKNYYVLSYAPTSLSWKALLGVAAGFKSMGEAIEFNGDQPGRILMIPRDGSEPIIVEVDSHFCFHFANGFEDEDGRVIIDMVRVDTLMLGDGSSSSEPLWATADFQTIPKSLLWRYEVSPAGQWSRRQLSDRPLDFPSIAPRLSGRRHRFAYCAAVASTARAGPAQGLAKIDAEEGSASETWMPEPHQFLGESLFVPRCTPDAEAAKEDDGYVVGLLFDGRARRSELLVFDAQSVATGPICRVPLRGQLPHGLHGCWSSDLVPSKESVAAAWSASPLP
uniref:9-cis-epoxycarotenoid dioxygenase n=1 Tax=Scrippsiella trochoidea TaxID=71861 RepID=A0A1L2D737_SCRTR|nr:9-cis-epoxycarotenoid dioxygenase [Scrippsiella trochoidea]